MQFWLRRQEVSALQDEGRREGGEVGAGETAGTGEEAGGQEVVKNPQGVVHIDCFDSVSDIPKRKRTYDNIKSAVLEAGRFSVFDVNDKHDGYIFTKLCEDPELEIDNSCGFPWTNVRRKAVES